MSEQPNTHAEFGTHIRIAGARQSGKSNTVAIILASSCVKNADGSFTVTGAMMPRFDWTDEERQAATNSIPGLQLIDPDEEM
jgi:hypothetical protein